MGSPFSAAHRISAHSGPLPADFSGKALSLQMIQENFYPTSARPSMATSHEGLASNVVMAPVFWIMRTFTEAQLVVQKRLETDVGKRLWENVPDHDLEILVDRPNPFYNGNALWKATLISYVLAGNGYWLKVRNSFGAVVQLWYVPHWCMEPRWPLGGGQFISHYDYTPDHGTPLQLPPADVLHFRFGLDPENTRKGVSPIRPLLREVWTDEQCAQFSEAIVRNMGVPGLVMSPKDNGWKPKPEDVKELENYLNAAHTGERRGKAMVMRVPTDLHQFGFDPNKLMLANLRDISEERVCAVLGIPAAVVGFGSGLQSTKVGATMRELRRLAWVQCLTPMQKDLATEVTTQMLPDFQSHLRRFRAWFDTSEISSFPEDDNLRAERVRGLVKDGILRVDRAQAMLGLEVDDTQQVYLRPTASAPVDESGEPLPVAPDTAPSTDPTDDIPDAIAERLNGNGAAHE